MGKTTLPILRRSGRFSLVGFTNSAQLTLQSGIYDPPFTLYPLYDIDCFFLRFPIPLDNQATFMFSLPPAIQMNWIFAGLLLVFVDIPVQGEDIVSDWGGYAILTFALWFSTDKTEFGWTRYLATLLFCVSAVGFLKNHSDLSVFETVEWIRGFSGILLFVLVLTLLDDLEKKAKSMNIARLRALISKTKSLYLSAFVLPYVLPYFNMGRWMGRFSSWGLDALYWISLAAVLGAVLLIRIMMETKQGPSVISM